MNSTGTPTLRPSSRATSEATPRGSLADEPGVTSRKLPWLSPTLSFPEGAIADRTASVISVAMAPDVSTNHTPEAMPSANPRRAAGASGRRPVLEERALDRDLVVAEREHVAAV